MNVGWDHLSNMIDMVNLKFPKKVNVGLVDDTSNNYKAL